jgi:hypothetical protein
MLSYAQLHDFLLLNLLKVVRHYSEQLPQFSLAIATDLARKMTRKPVRNLSMSMTSTSTKADEQKGGSISQISFKGSGCFKGGYAGINLAADAGIAVVDATGECEVANSTFEADITPNDGVAEDLDPRSGLRRLSAGPPANVQTDEFESTSKSAEVDHEGASGILRQALHTRVFGLGVCWKFPWRSPKFQFQSLPPRLPPTETRTLALRFYANHPELILATSTLRPTSPASTSTFDPTTYGAFLRPVVEERATSSKSSHYFADLHQQNLLVAREMTLIHKHYPFHPVYSSPSTTQLQARKK